jgi:hypothetical protein
VKAQGMRCPSAQSGHKSEHHQNHRMRP